MAPDDGESDTAPLQFQDPDEGEGFSGTSSIRGAASLSPREMSKAIGAKERQLSRKQTNMLNAAARDSRESLLLKVRDVVDRLGVDPRVKEAVIEKVEVLATRIRRRSEDEGSQRLTENEAALAATIRVMQGYGWSIDQVARKVATMNRRIVAIEDLKVSVLLDDAVVTNGDNLGISVRVAGEEREVSVLNRGGNAATKLLRVQAYATDDGKLLEISGASICASFERKKGGGASAFCPSDPRRLEVIDAHRAVVKIGGGESFEALKLLERAELGGGIHSPHTEKLTRADDSGSGQERVRFLLRRYRTEKLPLTEYLANGAGALMQLRTRYYERFAERFDPAKVRERLRSHTEDDGDPLLRSPRLLAHEAIRQADTEVFASLPGHLKVTVRRLAAERSIGGRRVGIIGFLVERELKAWEE